ncbi:Glutamate 5-kinase [Elusimicrobium minutum Pei191]|uniref:Glutamate 5-kinase n=1 Tax=Elusimicrobium minutum (strain Pei191) TaxID=445932 RepID=B2KEI5_ELUMP|nr:glutamate 5-kinase [Elusimicrobium minutum]ACC98931.1 Glutamate 5-kinase [Elusimicrobium minutum Pei191]
MRQNISKKMFQKAEIIVFKVGSSLIVDSDGETRDYWIDSLAEDIRDLACLGKKSVIVSSGAIALGRKILGFGVNDKLTLSQKQAAAAVGQIKLCELYRNILKIKRIKTAQVLLTRENANNEKTFLNATNTLNALLAMNVVPIINENDTISTEEIRFGDNDKLSALVSQMVDADILVLLSDIDGLYTNDPKISKKAKFVPLVKEINENIEKMAAPTKSALGTGGMASKICAAKMCVAADCSMVITTGAELYPVRRLIQKGRCTWFVPGDTK